MLNYLEIEANGKVYHFRMRSADMTRIEKETGKSIFDCLGDASITTVANMLMYMRRFEDRNFSMGDATNLFDELVDAGYTITSIMDDIIYETLSLSGLLSKGELEKIREQQNISEKNQEE